MKRIGLLTVAAAAVLLAALAGTSLAGGAEMGFGRSETWPAILLGDAGYDHNESIGTGTMNESESGEPAVVEEKTEAVEPSFSGPGNDEEAIGTGSMPLVTGESPGYDGPPRVDVDLP
jgi:hypothetical protein